VEALQDRRIGSTILSLDLNDQRRRQDRLERDHHGRGQQDEHGVLQHSPTLMILGPARQEKADISARGRSCCKVDQHGVTCYASRAIMIGGHLTDRVARPSAVPALPLFAVEY
jgi:hypothetical protein